MSPPPLILPQPQLEVMASIGLWLRVERIVFVCFLVLVIVSPSYSALTPEERQALQQIVQAFPDLTSASPYDSNPPDPNANASWNTSFPDDWCNRALGVSPCAQNNPSKFDSIRLNDGWGLYQGTDLSSIGNLPGGHTFIDTSLFSAETEAFWKAFMSSNISLGTIKDYSAPSETDWSGVENKTSLLELRAAIPPSFNASKLINLKTFHNLGIMDRYGVITDEFVEFDLPLSIMNRSLLYLENVRLVISPSVWNDVTVGLYQYTYWGCTACQWTLNTPISENTINLALTSTLVSIYIADPLGAGRTAKFLFNTPSLTEIRLSNFPPGATIALGDLPALTELTLNNVSSLPEGLDTVGTLKKATLKIPTNFTWLASLPWLLANQTALTEIHLEGPFDTTTLEDAICSLHPTLKILEIIFSDPSPTNLVWPTCTANLISLETLIVSAHRQFDLGDLVSKLPATLKDVRLKNVFDQSSPLNFLSFYALPSLVTLEISGNGLTGLIPDNFLTAFVNITGLTLRGNSLSGKVLNQGLASLQYLDLTNNSFTSWDNLLSAAPNLQAVYLSNNLLSSIPTDANLLSIPRLGYLSIANNPALSGALPSFWTSHPWMKYFNASGCSFSGPIQYPQGPSIMQALDLSKNALVGSLPPAPVPVMDLSGNRLSGSIPMSWVNAKFLIISLNLKGNDLSGTVPRNLFKARTLLRATLIDLSDTRLQGPLFEMSNLRSKIVLNLQNTSFDFCIQDPGLPSLSTHPRARPTCNIPPNAHCNCQQLYESCQLSTATCTISCIPPPGYRCGTNNEYILDGDVSEPSFPVPQGDVIVGGSVNSGTKIVFEGSGTTLTVSGCIGDVDIEVVFDQAKSTDSKVVVNQLGSNCTSSLAELKVTVKTKNSSCKKVQVDTSGSTRSTLSIAFNVSDRGCNTKWIILGSVLGGVLIIGVVVVVLLVTFNPKVRGFFLPYDGANS